MPSINTEIRRHLLDLAIAGEIHIRSAADKIAARLGLTEEDKQETIRGQGDKRRYVTRTNWSATYLRKAGLVRTTRPGYVEATPEGKQFREKHDGPIMSRDLEQFPAFVDFLNRKGTRQKATSQLPPDESASAAPASDEETAPELIAKAVEEIESALASDLLERIGEAPPAFFENLILKLLRAMGYGTSEDDALHLGQSGDGGIDGVIYQDKLGLDKVYIQAKRYTPENKVTASAIRNFIGALNRGNKGVFVTTSAFTEEACKTAADAGKSIVLIDGERLASLMIEHNVGCEVESEVHIKKIDEDFFDS